MKKAFWGYDVKAVDDEIGRLEAQNYKLTQKIKHLENERGELDLQLQELSGEVKAARAAADSAAAVKAAATAQQDAAAKAVEAAKREAAAARAAAEQARMAAAAMQEELNALRSRPAASAKDLTREKMEQLLAAYAEGWKHANQRMKQLLAQISASRERAREAFVQSANDILRNFDGMGAAADTVSSSLADFESRQGDIMGEFGEILSMLEDAEVPAAEPQAEEPAQESTQEPEDIPVILKEIKARLASLRRAEAQLSADAPKAEAPAAPNQPR